MKKLSNKEINAITEVILDKLRVIEKDKREKLKNSHRDDAEVGIIAELCERYYNAKEELNQVNQELYDRVGYFSFFHDKEKFISNTIDNYINKYFSSSRVSIESLRRDINNELIIKNIFESAEDNFIDSIVDKYKDKT